MKLTNVFTSLGSFYKLYIGFHDYLLQTSLPQKLQEHRAPVCLKNKLNDNKVCYQFCGSGGTVDKEVIKHTEGWFHSCPWGVQKISLPIFDSGELVGVLFGIDVGGKPSLNFKKKGIRAAMLALCSYVEKKIGILKRSEEEHEREGRAEQVRNYIEKNIEAEISLSDLARLFGVSVEHLSRWIHKHLGHSFREIVLRERLKSSAFTLARTDIPIIDIARKFRFCDQSHFSKMFKKVYGLSPRVYRSKWLEM